MSKRDRGGLFSIVTALFLGLIAVLSLITTWQIATLAAKDGQQAEHSAKEYADRTHERIASACVNMSGLALAECADEIIKTTHEAQTAQYDLAAQRGMERWAMAMFWATFASICVTGVGIYYVRETLTANSAAVDQAKVANEIAAASALADRRAWLSFEVSTPSAWSFKNGRVSGAIELRVENIGREPAMHCRLLCHADVARGYGGAETKPIVHELLRQSVEYWPVFKFIMPNHVRTETVYFDEIVDETDKMLPRIYILVAYRMAASKDDKYTLMSFDSARPGISTFASLQGAVDFKVSLRYSHGDLAT
jgi:hypothetical protein